MSLLTYVLAIGFLIGVGTNKYKSPTLQRLRDTNAFHRFTPEVLGLTATSAFAVTIFEVVVIKMGCYLLSIGNEVALADLFALSGYKFIR